MNKKYLQLNQLKHQQLVGWACWFEEIDSTNLQAKRLLNQQSESQPGCTEVGERSSFPWLIVADQQTLGRGRGSNRWWSPKGCLMLTLVVEASSLHSNRSRWAELALVCGLACAEAVDSCNENARVALKWPNDLYLDGNKLGGILIETESANHWLVGIGINATLEDENPQGLNQVADVGVSVEQLLGAVCDRVVRRIECWRDDSWDWYASWLPRCLLTNKQVVLEAGDREISGVCAGVDAQGHLVITTEDGQSTRHVSGSIKSFR